MRIGAVNSFNYAQNNASARQKNQSFGNLQPTEDYARRLSISATDEELDSVVELCKKPINLKQLLKYDELPQERKALFDEYFEYTTAEGIVDDLKVEADASSNRHWFQTNTSTKLFGKSSIDLKFQLPNPYNREVYKDCNLGGKLNLERDYKYSKPINKLIKNTDAIVEGQNKFFDKRGFVLNKGNCPIPTDKVFDALAAEINNHIDCYAKAKEFDTYRNQSIVADQWEVNDRMTKFDGLTSKK